MNLKTNKPLYLQVEAAIRNDIQQKKYLPGEQLPTEEEMCTIYNVSKITIRKAFKLLTESGLVERQRGRGTFVKPKKENLAIGDDKGFNSFLSSRGHKVENSILHTQRMKADEFLAKKLHIKIGDSVVNIKRLMLEDNTPIGTDDFYVEDAKYPGILDDISSTKSLYQLLSEKYRVDSYRSELALSGVIATPETAELLQCLTGDPLFVVEKVSFNDKEEVIHYSSSLVRCDRVTYIIRTGPNGDKEVTVDQITE